MSQSKSRLVSKVGSEATQEAVLLAMLDKVKQQWIATEFTTKPFKDSRDAMVLGSVDDVLATLEETQLVVQSVTGSPYVAALRNEAEELLAERHSLPAVPPPFTARSTVCGHYRH